MKDQTLVAEKHKPRSRSDKKREAILAAAADLFPTHGFVQTSMDQIASAAGVSKQTVYSHFGDKKGVFISAIRSKCIEDSLSEALFEQSIPVEELLLQLANHLHRLLLSEDTICLTRLCISGAEQHPEVSEMFYQAGADNLNKLLINYLEKQAEAGILGIDNSQFAAWHFLQMVNGDAPLRAKLGMEQCLNAEEMQQYLQSCVNAFLRAYKI